MEAKDTVVPVGDHSESIWCPHCGEEFGIESKIEMGREEQAEISFKAGIREVVEWIEDQCVFKGREAGTMEMKVMKWWWQAKLKEWGGE